MKTIFRNKYYNQPSADMLFVHTKYFNIFPNIYRQKTPITPIVLPCPVTCPSMETGASPHHIITNKTCGNIESLKIDLEELRAFKFLEI